MNDLVSVVVPAYNREKTIARALESVISQSYPQWEVIVADDGSIDRTRVVAEEYSARDSRIRVVGYQKRQGAQAARNTGIRSAKGAWISFLDSDDYYLPDSIQLRFDTAKREKVEVVHSECLVLNHSGPEELFRVPPLSGNVYRQLLIAPGPVFPGLLVTRQALEKCGMLNEQMVSFQEWDTCIRLARDHPFAFVREPTFVYDCRNADSISRSARKAATGYEQILKYHFDEILKLAGPGKIAGHYAALKQWYGKARKPVSWLRCEFLFYRWRLAGHFARVG